MGERKMKNKKSKAEKVRWDLSILYAGIDDPQLDLDVSGIVKKSKDFYLAHKGKLKTTLGKAIKDYEEIEMLTGKVMVYLYLKSSLDVTESTVKSKKADVEIILGQSEGEYLTFFEIEIAELEDKVLKKIYAKDSNLRKYRPWLNHIRLFKPHMLSEPVESALTKRSSFGSDAWAEFFDEMEADLEFTFSGGKKTLEEMLHIVTNSKDASTRFKAMSKINGGFKGTFAKFSAQTLYMVTGSGGIENKERVYTHPMEYRNKSNRIPDVVVDALHTAVRDIAGPLTRKYYQLKAAHLGFKKLNWSDRNAPMPFADNTIIPFEDAVETVYMAYDSFSPVLARLFTESLQKKRIDAPTTKGKRGGAYNYTVVLPDKTTASFTFLNYQGSNRDVMTLAHETGHAVHGLLAGEAQGVLLSEAPMAYCETASIFGEMTTFNFLKKRLIDKDDIKSALALTMYKIDDVINSAVRQIGFSNFERRVHGMDASYSTWSEPKKLSVEELNAIWLETTKELYGEEGEVFIYKNTEHLWAYVSHFHRPFYVYSYAFGQLLTASLYAKQSDFGNQFEPLYLDMLRSGGTRNVVELLKPFGLDPTAQDFWSSGIYASLGKLLDEAIELSRARGIVLSS